MDQMEFVREHPRGLYTMTELTERHFHQPEGGLRGRASRRGARRGGSATAGPPPAHVAEPDAGPRGGAFGRGEARASRVGSPDAAPLAEAPASRDPAQADRERGGGHPQARGPCEGKAAAFAAHAPWARRSLL